MWHKCWWTPCNKKFTEIYGYFYPKAQIYPIHLQIPPYLKWDEPISLSISFSSHKECHLDVSLKVLVQMNVVLRILRIQPWSPLSYYSCSHNDMLCLRQGALCHRKNNVAVKLSVRFILQNFLCFYPLHGYSGFPGSREKEVQILRFTGQNTAKQLLYVL